MTRIFKEIPIEEAHKRLLYNADTGEFTWKFDVSRNVKSNSVAGCKDRLGYVKIKIMRVQYYAHRIAAAMIFGIGTHDEVDHINGDTSDNRIANLRISTRGENMRNAPQCKNNTTGHKGVTYHKRDGKYQASVRTDSGRLYLGYFDTAVEAAAAYDAAALKYHNDFFYRNGCEHEQNIRANRSDTDSG